MCGHRCSCLEATARLRTVRLSAAAVRPRATVGARSVPWFPALRHAARSSLREFASAYWAPAFPRSWARAHVFLQIGGKDGGHGKSQSFDAADQVAPKPL